MVSQSSEVFKGVEIGLILGWKAGSGGNFYNSFWQHVKGYLKHQTHLKFSTRPKCWLGAPVYKRATKIDKLHGEAVGFNTAKGENVINSGIKSMLNNS